MNKLIVTLVASFIMLPVVAMDIMTLTEDESKNFTKLLSSMVTSGNAMIEANKISANHPLHSMHSQLSEELASSNGGLLAKMRNNESLRRVIQHRAYDIEKNEDFLALQQELSDQLYYEGISKPEKERAIIWARKIHADELLQELYPVYVKNLSDKTEEEDRYNFMIKNQNYPTDEKAEQDYIATLIYKYTLAQRVPLSNNNK